jgi:hypothetical protein
MQINQYLKINNSFEFFLNIYLGTLHFFWFKNKAICMFKYLIYRIML